MPQKSKLSKTQWVEILAKEELPAITSIAAVLEKFSNDDVSSIPQLSRVILHDQALSSRLLKVANSVNRSPVHKVNTVSRAAIVLGIQTVKNICLTAKILDGITKSEKLSPAIYERQMTLMANAFFAALLARTMLPHYDDETLEEVYLAALLYHIGETAFWNIRSGWARKLIVEIARNPQNDAEIAENMLGISFNELSIGLAKTWKLGDLLTKALDNPHTRTVEIRVISLANQLAQIISTPADKRLLYEKTLQDIAQLTKLSEPEVKQRIQRTRKVAIELLSSYGASVLHHYLKPIPSSADFAVNPSSLHLPTPAISKEQLLLNAQQHLTQQVQTQSSVNNLVSACLRHMAIDWHLDCCAFWLLSIDKQHLEIRNACNETGASIPLQQNVAIDHPDNQLVRVFKQNQATVFKPSEAQWHKQLSAKIQKQLVGECNALLPVSLAEKKMGIVWISKAQGNIHASDVVQLSKLAEHLALCLKAST